MVTFKAEPASAGLEEGKHNGIVDRIEYRTEPYAYTDIYIKVDGAEFKVKYSAPSNLREGGELRNTLSKFTTIEDGQEVDIDNILVGKKVTFQTTNKTGKKGGTFAEVIKGTLKPLK